jgi:hypothetical protein
MYQCKFTAVGGAYSIDKYDLSILADDGYEVLEVYDIKKQ